MFKIGNDLTTAIQNRGTMSIRMFLGKLPDFALWKISVKGYFAFKGLHDTLKMSYKDKMPPDDAKLDINQAEDQALYKAWQENQMAVSLLTCTQTDEDLIMEITRIIRENTDHPAGLACKIWAGIQYWMTPYYQYSRLDMQEDMLKSKLKKDQDPRQLSIAVKLLLSKYKESPSSKDIIAVVQQCGRDAGYGQSIDNYTDTMKMCMHREPTAQELIEKMKKQYRMTSRIKEKRNKADPESSLVTVPSGRFKGPCHWCGIPWHKEKKDCNKKKQGIPKKTTVAADAVVDPNAIDFCVFFSEEAQRWLSRYLDHEVLEEGSGFQAAVAQGQREK